MGVDVRVLYGSQTGNARRVASLLRDVVAGQGLSVVATDLKEYEVERLWREKCVLLVLPTYQGGAPPDSAAWFCQWLDESSTDFRVGTTALDGLRYGVFGCGNSLYEDDFNAVAKKVDRQLRSLGGHALSGVGLGDEQTGDYGDQGQAWAATLLPALAASNTASKGDSRTTPQAAATTKASSVGADAGSLSRDGTGDAALRAADVGDGGEAAGDNEEYESQEEEEDAADGAGAGSGEDVDMEDLAGPSNGRRAAAAAAAGSGSRVGPGIAGQQATVKPAKPMLNATQRASLVKQGYKIIGTNAHSGVKLCRWTKSMLRGRGGCYKHAFYGIDSHRCMEATPSLACANKCVFCWRHHTNPVGKEWKWLMDPAEEIVQAAVSKHVGMVNEYKGVPGVLPHRLEEGYQVKHCALSLVGEPIMYPQISKLVGELHARRISTFLVTNAQFPDALRALRPVTQLYVSVDAATRESLKAVDRPLFKDFWERFQECLSLLRDKRQRTVYRLTLVKGWNTEELEAYACLLDLGRPDFIEVKGVTYCGSSGASNLTMANVPYHEDVRAFCSALADARGGEYGLAAEHEHSCCVLLARKDRFYKEGRWHTWIDYEKFQDLAASGEPFGSEDYLVPTPDWAAFGSEEAGFDPQETRVRKVRNHPGQQQAVTAA